MYMVDWLVRSDRYCLHSSHLKFDQILLQICPSFDCHDCCLIYDVISEYKDDQLIRLDWLNWNVIQISMCTLYILYFYYYYFVFRLWLKAVSSFCLFLFKDRFSVWYSTHLFLKWVAWCQMFSSHTEWYMFWAWFCI